VVDARLIQPALEAARKALRLLDEDHVPAGLRRVAAWSGPRLPAPLERTLAEHLERLDWLRDKAVEHLPGDADAASRAFLERPGDWQTILDERASLRAGQDHDRLVESLESANARLSAQVAGLAADLTRAREDVERLRLESRIDAERERLSQANRELRARIGSLERLVEDQRSQGEALEGLLAEADRRISELKRRLSSADRESAVAGGSPIPRVFGAGDPLALARSLDQLVEALARVDVEVARPPVSAELALPVGIRPDHSTAIEWMLGLPRPVTVLIDGYNVGHELSSNPDAAVRMRLEHVASRLRRLAEGPLRVIIFWDSGIDPTGWRSQGVDVRYVPSADDAIVEQSGPGTVVISSDRAVREASEARGSVGLWSQALSSWME
jgi:phage shock protein A